MLDRHPPIDGPIESRKRKLRDIDAAERAFLIRAGIWLAGPFLLFAFLISVFSGSLLAGLAFLVVEILFFYLAVYRGLIGGTTWFFGRIYGVGTTGTPHPKTYWRAHALMARGDSQLALDSLEAEALDEPHNPEPCLRAAAICARELHDARAALDWYRRAQRASGIDVDTDAYVSTRLVELYEELGEGGHAMVELRKLMTLHPESRYAEGARARLAALKERQFESGDQADAV